MINYQLPLVIVVKAVLGNVNHAVLTAEYARIHGLKVVGLIVNGWDRKKAGALEQSNLYYYEKLTTITKGSFSSPKKSLTKYSSVKGAEIPPTPSTILI